MVRFKKTDRYHRYKSDGCRLAFNSIITWGNMATAEFIELKISYDTFASKGNNFR